MKYSDIPLPKIWPNRVKSAFINAVSLAHAAITYSRGWCADSPIRRVQLAGELDRAKQEIAGHNGNIFNFFPRITPIDANF